MKKAVAIVGMVLFGLALFAGCGQIEEAAEEVSAIELDFVSVEALEMEEPKITHEGEAQSDLTGEWISEELAAQRPLAVMLGNTSDACPQYGIGDADIVYEVPVEGSLTRLMAIFQDYATVEKIMSIRSCRLYYIDWALEFDAIYMHYGQAYLAKSMLSQSYVNNLSGLDGSLDSIFYRDSSRVAPHNAYVTGESVVSGISIKGYDTEHSDD